MGTPANHESNRRAPRLRPAHMVPSSYRERPAGVGGLGAGEEASRVCSLGSWGRSGNGIRDFGVSTQPLAAADPAG
jgi:hypothetical protein